jgi:hypothetical protein
MINIVNLEREPQNNGVLVAHWTATKATEDFTANTYGTKSFTPDPESEGFTAFEDLTESMVVGWFSDEEVAQIESVLDADLEAQAQPQVISGTPW